MDYFSYPEFVFEQFSGSSFELPQLNIATKSKALARNFLISVLLAVALIIFVMLLTFVVTIGAIGALIILIRYNEVTQV